ncbi:MAG: radical SAM protein [Ruminococcaceae bacterium]|nr:radical SAM protein [Oscillospiraceae bacterium]
MEENKLTLKNSALLVSLICNLNCKLCAAYSPYRKSNKFEEVETLIDYVRKYFDVVDYVEVFAISGGEPLLYKQLPKLLSEFLKYSDHFGKIEIHANGTILPSTELLDIIKTYGDKFKRFLIDNYGEKLSTKIPEFTSLLDEHKIPYVVRDYFSENMHCSGWVDFGELTQKIHSCDEASELFSKCAYPKKMKLCNIIIEGSVIPCNPIIRRWLDGTADYSEYIDLNDETMSLQEQRSKLSDIQKAEVFCTCEFCNGLCDDSRRFKPAEQLTAEEIRKIRGAISE